MTRVSIWRLGDHPISPLGASDILLDEQIGDLENRYTTFIDVDDWHDGDEPGVRMGEHASECS